MSSNIITRVRYKKDVNFQRLVGGWCKYVSKDGADGKSLKDFSSMNDLYEKEFGIFDDTKNFDEYYIWDKNGDVSKTDILKDIPNDVSEKVSFDLQKFVENRNYDKNSKLICKNLKDRRKRYVINLYRFIDDKNHCGRDTSSKYNQTARLWSMNGYCPTLTANSTCSRTNPDDYIFMGSTRIYLTSF